MPIKRAALRSLRKDERRTARNTIARSELKTLKKRMATLMAQSRDEAKKFLPEFMRHLDQAAAKGRIHPNHAARTKSRVSRHVLAK
jgi:small subunit ribosomal protein S20